MAKFQLYSVIALTTIYGVDESRLMISRCRKQLYNLFIEQYVKVVPIAKPFPLEEPVNYILSTNIIWGDNDSLTTIAEYDPQPLEFPIWSFNDDGMVKRTDFALRELVERSLRIDENLFSSYTGQVRLQSPRHKYPPCSIAELHGY